MISLILFKELFHFFILSDYFSLSHINYHSIVFSFSFFILFFTFHKQSGLFHLLKLHGAIPDPREKERERKEMEREKRENKQSIREGMRGLPGMFFKGMRPKTSQKNKNKDKKDSDSDNVTDIDSEKATVKSAKMGKKGKSKRHGTEEEEEATYFDDERRKGEVTKSHL